MSMILNSMFNLELLQKYGANAWRVHNYQLESQLKMLQKETEEYREKIREISRERKNEQVNNNIDFCWLDGSILHNVFDRHKQVDHFAPWKISGLILSHKTYKWRLHVHHWNEKWRNFNDTRKCSRQKRSVRNKMILSIVLR